MINADEPFIARRWGTGLAHVLLACPTATAADEVSLLRQGYGAIAEAGALTAAYFKELPPVATFEAMLLCGALESAALSLLPQGASFMLSRGASGRHLGSVFMTGCGEHTAEGNTAALAMMAAALSAWRKLLSAQAADRDLLN